MKSKIFQKLKQAYSSLGLGDDVLLAQADALQATGIVTEDNIDMIVTSQKSFLETLQKTTDKRVTDAQNKAKESTMQELKAKHEAEAKAREEEQAKAKALAEQKKQEEEAQKAKEKEMPEWYKQDRSELENRIKAILEQNQSMGVLVSELQKQNETLKSQAEETERNRIAKERNEFITSKAKELGVPQWRIEEGLSIASDADETAITSYLSKVANNIKVASLPDKGNRSPLSDDTPKKEDLDAIAKKLIG